MRSQCPKCRKRQVLFDRETQSFMCLTCGHDFEPYLLDEEEADPRVESEEDR